ncbi:MAG TPA: MBL fold metallo-hydrolase [Actinophytocola sp.]|jgi:ribonuclease BN (tRNA processing enzyme)|nr:MBL fold metallo-hydrolase [Actinophytocola sp.]
MRLTVLGGGGVWPGAGGACGGFLLEHDGFRLLVDPGFAVVPRLLRVVGAGEVDAVYVTHGHPDHCADLNPLLRARALSGVDMPALPVYAPDGAVDAVLALDRAGMLDCDVRPVADRFHIGPFAVEARMLPHSLPNAGVRLAAGGEVLAYTGDSAPCADVVALARDADVFVAEATFLDDVPDGARGVLSTARDAGRQCALAGAGRLLLTHLQPGTDPAAAVAVAGEEFGGEIAVAVPEV